MVATRTEQRSHIEPRLVSNHCALIVMDLLVDGSELARPFQYFLLYSTSHKGTNSEELGLKQTRTAFYTRLIQLPFITTWEAPRLLLFAFERLFQIFE